MRGPLALCLLGAASLWGQTAAEMSDQAQQLAARSQPAEAEKLWLQALDKQPTFFPALFNLGLLRYGQKRFAEAEPMLRQAAQQRPNEFTPHYVLGATLAQLGRREEGLREWRAARRLQPKNPRLLHLMSVEYSKGRYFQEAAQAAAEMVQLKPDDASVYFVAIKAHQDAGDTAAALALAGDAARRFPTSARAQFEYGFHLQKTGQVEEGLKRLEQAMALDPAYEEPFFFYGDLLLKRGEAERALAPLRKAIENRPDYVPARVTLARALTSLKRWPEALAELEETVRRDPKHPQPHLLLSQIHFQLGDEDKARRAKELSLRLRREQPALLEAQQGRPFPEQ